MKTASWKLYYDNLKKNIALKLQDQCAVDYGTLVYSSPTINDMRWIVMCFANEYNVFVERYIGNVSDKIYSANFAWKESAMAFALEMSLVCNGKISRKDRHRIDYE